MNNYCVILQKELRCSLPDVKKDEHSIDLHTSCLLLYTPDLLLVTICLIAPPSDQVVVKIHSGRKKIQICGRTDPGYSLQLTQALLTPGHDTIGGPFHFNTIAIHYNNDMTFSWTVLGKR